MSNFMQPVRPDPFVSHREKRDRDRVMGAVRQRLANSRLKANRILFSNRAMPIKVRERIMRGEFDSISLRRAYLIAEAVGVDIELQASA